MTEITKDLKKSLHALHDTFFASDGRKVRLINDDLLVKMDPLPEKSSGGIIIPTTVGERGDDGIYSTGTVVAVGYMKTEDEEGVHRRFKIPDIDVGDKVLFIRFLAEQHSNKQIQSRIEEGLIRVKWFDVIVAYDKADESRLRSMA